MKVEKVRGYQRRTNVSTTSTTTIPRDSNPIRAKSLRTWSSSWTGNSTSWDRLRRVGQDAFGLAGCGGDDVAPVDSPRAATRAPGVVSPNAASTDESCSPVGDSTPVARRWEGALPSARTPPFVVRGRAVLRRWLLDRRFFRAIVWRYSLSKSGGCRQVWAYVARAAKRSLENCHASRPCFLPLHRSVATIHAVLPFTAGPSPIIPRSVACSIGQIGTVHFA